MPICGQDWDCSHCLKDHINVCGIGLDYERDRLVYLTSRREELVTIMRQCERDMLSAETPKEYLEAVEALNRGEQALQSNSNKLAEQRQRIQAAENYLTKALAAAREVAPEIIN